MNDQPLMTQEEIEAKVCAALSAAIDSASDFDQFQFETIVSNAAERWAKEFYKKEYPNSGEYR